MKSQEAYEVIMNEKFYLLSSSRLPDGSTLQFATDINDTKKQETELLRLKNGIETLPNGMMFWDQNDDLIAFNESAQKFLKEYGFDLKIGKNFKELRKYMVLNHQTPPKGISVEKHLKNREHAWKNLKGQNIRESNFTNHTLHFTDTRLKDGSTICLWTDITSIKKQENELVRLRDGIETLPNGLMFWDENDILIANNASSVRFFKEFNFDLNIGRSRNELLKHMILNDRLSIPGGLKKERFFKKVTDEWKTFKGKRLRENTFSNGKTILTTDTRLVDGSTISLYVDITDLKQVEKKQNQLVNAIDVMPNSISLWNKDDKLIMANKTSINDMKKLNFDLKPGVLGWQWLKMESN